MKTVGFTFGIISAATSALLEPSMFGERFLYVGFVLSNYLNAKKDESFRDFVKKMDRAFSLGRYHLWQGHINRENLMKLIARWNKFCQGPLLSRFFVYVVFNIIMYYIICSALGVSKLLKA